MSSKIKAAIRIRPFLKTQKKNGYINNCVKSNRNRKQVEVYDGTSKRNFNFDYIFDQNCSQDDVYDQCNINHLIDKALKGYHSTIFAYGQTGSGKTFTMHGEESNDEGGIKSGIIPRMVGSLYHQIKNNKDRTFMVSISFLQIYNQKIFDLLNNNSSFNSKNAMTGVQNGLRLRWNKDQQFTVQNLFVFQCKNEDQLLKYFTTGLKNRVNASHKLNMQSSRSHSILTIKIDSFDNFNQSNLLSSKIQLVDLAGSQRIGLTGTEGKLAKQSIDINKSLFTLRNVINVLADVNRNKKQKVYVPYRDSKLTSILKQSIGGNSFCLMIACINPNDHFIDQNLSTLTYATKASYITNQPTVNDDPRTKIITQLKRQVKGLNEELGKANQHIEFITSLQESKKNHHHQRDEEEDMPKFMPELSMKKGTSEKLNHSEQFSQRLVQSINMVRQLLKSNKELREKLQYANKRNDDKDLQIYELTKQNETFKEKYLGEGSSMAQTQLPQFPSNVNVIRNSTSMKTRRNQSNPTRQNTGQIQAQLNPDRIPSTNQNGNINGFSSLNSKNNFNYWNSVQINQYYMNQKGVDSVPTNFSRKEINSSHEKRVKEEVGPRNVITAKFNSRKNTHENNNKFLSFYNDKNQNYY